MTGEALLEVRDLSKEFRVGGEGLFARDTRRLLAVNDVSFSMEAGEVLALVGESGSGKTTLSRAIAMLEPPTRGSVRFQGQELTGLGRRNLRPVRRRIQLIYQDPYGSLNPRLTVGAIIGEPLAIHGIGSRDERQFRVAQLIQDVGLPPHDLARYPHQFSGGQRQRIAIARALALEPSLIIADEPVSALDVSVRSQVLNLLLDLRRSHGLTYLFVSHDLTVVRHIADRVAVMYLGRIVELAPTAEIFNNPRHPYTRALLDAVPEVGRGKRRPRESLAGEAPSALEEIPGCPFNPRCWITRAECFHTRPKLEPALGDTSHLAACHLRNEGRI